MTKTKTKTKTKTLKEVRGHLSTIGLESGAVKLVKGVGDGEYHVHVASSVIRPLAKSIIKMMQRMLPLEADQPAMLKEMPRGRNRRSGFAEVLPAYHLTLSKVADMQGDEVATYTTWDTMIPSQDEGSRIKGTGPFKTSGWIQLQKVSAEERIVIGAVLVPEVVDGTRTVDPQTHEVLAVGDIYSEEEIRQAMYWWMEYGDHRFAYNHTNKPEGRFLASKSGATLLECWQAREDTKIGSQLFTKGTWIVTVRVNDDTLWKEIKLGNIKSFSIEAACMGEIERAKNPVMA